MEWRERGVWWESDGRDVRRKMCVWEVRESRSEGVGVKLEWRVEEERMEERAEGGRIREERRGERERERERGRQ